MKDVAEVIAVNLTGLAVSLNIYSLLDFFNLANDFFLATQYVWKSLPLIATFIYTLFKIIHEVRKYRRRSDSSDYK